MIHDLFPLAQSLQQRAKVGLEAFDAAWKEGGIPLALERHGEAVIRAQVQYQAAVDLEAVLRGASSLEDLVRELRAAAADDADGPVGRMARLSRTIAREEARSILGQLMSRTD